MLTIRRLVIGAVATLVAAVPVAAPMTASAGPTVNAYRSTSVKDDLGDVMETVRGTTVADPTIDIYKMSGYRYAKNFVLTVSYKHLTRAPYTHRFVQLEDLAAGDVRRSTLIDLGAGADGGRPATTVIVTKADSANETETVYELACDGARASPDYATSRVTYTLPVDCLKNYDQSEAAMTVYAARWSRSDWRRLVSDSYGSLARYDLNERIDLWTWDRSVTPSADEQGRARSQRPVGF